MTFRKCSCLLLLELRFVPGAVQGKPGLFWAWHFAQVKMALEFAALGAHTSWFVLILSLHPLYCPTTPPHVPTSSPWNLVYLLQVRMLISEFMTITIVLF